MSKLTDEFEKWLPKHQGELSIIHNPHRTNYQTADDFIAFNMLESDFASPADQATCVANDDFWIMTWYPETPVSCHSIAASTLEKLLLFVHDARFRSDGNE